VLTRSRGLSIILLALACLYGVADAFIKGHHGGTRSAIGNMSAPWALIPLLATAFVRPSRVVAGALIGASFTIAALASYLWVRVARGGGSHGYAALTVASLGNRWFVLGSIGGAALGALGAQLAKGRKWTAIGMISASLMVLEPLSRVVWATVKGEPPRTLIPSPEVWVVEVLCGGVAWFVLRNRLARGRYAVNSERSPTALGPLRVSDRDDQPYSMPN
jgi:hypothetical protein